MTFFTIVGVLFLLSMSGALVYMGGLLLYCAAMCGHVRAYPVAAGAACGSIVCLACGAIGFYEIFSKLQFNIFIGG